MDGPLYLPCSWALDCTLKHIDIFSTSETQALLLLDAISHSNVLFEISKLIKYFDKKPSQATGQSPALSLSCPRDTPKCVLAHSCSPLLPVRSLGL